MTPNVTMLLQGKNPDDQVGYHTAFREQFEKGRLAGFRAIPYRGATTKGQWMRLWEEVIDHIRSSGSNVLYLQYFHSRSVIDPRPALDELKALPSRPLIVTSCGDGFGPFGNAPPRSFLQAAGRSDLVLSTSLGRIASLVRRAGAARISLMPHSACDVRFGGIAAPPAPAARDHDLVFIGSRYGGRNPRRRHFWAGRRRDAWIKELSKRYGVRFALYGRGWDGIKSWQGPAKFDEQPTVCQSARAVFGGYPGSRQPYYASNRPFIQMLSGVPMIDFHVPGVNRLLADRTDWLLFRDLQESFRLIDGLLDGHIDGAGIGATGAETVRTQHMNSHRVGLIVEMLEELLAARHLGRAALCPPYSYLVDGPISEELPPPSIGW
jgi:hypothetical protein